jgi:hypothetical protein
MNNPVQNVQGDASFISSNGIIAKFAFLILVLILFLVALRLGSSLITWIMSPSQNPTLIKGMIDAKQQQRILQNPALKGSKPVLRSNNNTEGLEFSWSVWLFVDDFSYKEHEYKHVFHKGNDNINVSTPPVGMNFPNNAPGLYITPDTNNLLVVMNTFNKINDEVIVPDLPLNKWVNVILRVSNQHQLDIYINGTLAKRHILEGIPKQNYGDVFVGMNGGFSGYVASLRYFDYALGTNRIQTLMEEGPNMKLIGGDPNEGTQPQYLSNRWYFRGADDI